MHQNSLKAFKEIDRQKRRVEIYNFYYANRGISFTDRYIKNVLKFDDMNSVRPRITEMIKEGVLKEVGSDKDEVTGRTVRKVTSTVGAGELF